MWKRLAILAIAIFMAVYVSGQVNKAADNKQQPANHVQSPVAATVSPENQNKQDADLSKWYAVPDWWLAGIAFVTGCFICWQSWETRKSAKAALLSASAARLNAQALVNSERPWLIAETVKNSQIPHFYEIQITNCGRTPARFISGDAAYVFVERPDLLPVPPTYTSPFFIPKQVLIAPGKGFPIPPGYNIPHLLDMPQAANKTLVVYGHIIYEDTIIPDVVHETRWCFGYIPATCEQITQPLPPALQPLAKEILNSSPIARGDFVLTGPNDFTKHT